MTASGGRPELVSSRTGSAVRFGSRESGIWRIGKIVEPVQIATAVAASAAYPLFLPSLDRDYEFEPRDGTTHRDRVVLTDGGVFDNLGTSCLEPGRSEQYSYNVFPVDYIQVLLSDPQRDQTSLLLYNMLKAGSLPPANPGEYSVLG